MIDVIFSGITGGGLYIAITLGVVIVYRFAHTLNFAHAAIATLAAYSAWEALSRGLPYWFAVIIALVVSVTANIAVGLLITKFFLGATELVVTMATLGPALAITGAVGAIWGYDQKTLPTPEALRGAAEFGGHRISLIGLAVMGFIVLVTLALALALRITRQGVLLRAIADSRAVAALSGVSVIVLERGVWAFGGALAGGAGLLITPQLPLTPHALTNLLLVGIVAAVLGGLASLTGLVAGGVILGVAVALTQYYFQIQAGSTVALLMLIVVLGVRPSGLFRDRSSGPLGLFPQTIESEAGGNRKERSGHLVNVIRGQVARRGLVKARSRRFNRQQMPWWDFILIAVPSVILIAVAPYVFSDGFIFVLSTAAIYVVAIVGQNVLSGLSGQLSMAQGGFMLVGAYVAVILSVRMGISPPLAIICGAVAGISIAFMVSAGVSRLSGLYLAILTLVFTLAVPDLASSFPGLTGGDDGLFAPVFSIAGRTLSDSSEMFTLTASVAALTLIAVTFFKRSRLGLQTRGVRDSSVGAESMGIAARWSRTIAFCSAGGVAGLAGGFAAFQVGAVTPTSFDLWTSVYILFAAALGGAESTKLGPVVGAFFIAGLPYILSGSGPLSQVIFGLTVTLLLVIRSFLSGNVGVNAEEPVVIDVEGPWNREKTRA